MESTRLNLRWSVAWISCLPQSLAGWVSRVIFHGMFPRHGVIKALRCSQKTYKQITALELCPLTASTPPPPAPIPCTPYPPPPPQKKRKGKWTLETGAQSATDDIVRYIMGRKTVYSEHSVGPRGFHLLEALQDAWGRVTAKGLKRENVWWLLDSRATYSFCQTGW